MQSLRLGPDQDIQPLARPMSCLLRWSPRSRRRDAGTVDAGFQALLKLRRLHVDLDLAVRDAYGWQELDLEHGFHEVETLPENDRIRYTISPAARRESAQAPARREPRPRQARGPETRAPRRHAGAAGASPPTLVYIDGLPSGTSWRCLTVCHMAPTPARTGCLSLNVTMLSTRSFVASVGKPEIN